MDRAINIPKRITPCPILEADVQMRFDTNLGLNDAVFAKLYGRIKDQVASASQLPAMLVPEQMRQQDPKRRDARQRRRTHPPKKRGVYAAAGGPPIAFALGGPRLAGAVAPGP